jgi:hypothetical protein
MHHSKQYIVTALQSEINSRCPLVPNSAASLHLTVQLEDRLRFIALLRNFWIFNYKFYNIFKPYFNVYYLLQNLYIVHNINDIVMYISY